MKFVIEEEVSFDNRGGIRVIYYWYTSQGKILMLYAYSKSKQEDLTTDQLKILKNLLEED